MHESNTFADGVTDLFAFEACGIEMGEGIARRWGQAHHEVGGFIEGAGRSKFAAIPTLMAWATPAGPVTKSAYEGLIDRLLQAIESAGPLDAVLLALHGAMVAEGYPDADGNTLYRVRHAIGPDIPLVATLDYHANVSMLMVSASDALIAYRTYPHIDQRSRGMDAARIAAMAARKECRLKQALAKPPLLVPILSQETSREPMRSIMAEAVEISYESPVLDASVLAGFPYADVQEAGPACVVVTAGDSSVAQRCVEQLGDRFWTHRHALTTTPPSAEEAVRRALEVEKTPALLIDVGDNVGGGSAADSTVIFHEWIRQGGSKGIVVLFDPHAVRACLAAGVGEQIVLSAGGRVDRHAPPLPVSGRVRLVHDGRYVEDEPRHGGLRTNDQGLTAVVELADENLVVLTTRRQPPFSLGQLTSLGLRPENARAVVVKAAIAYKAAYEPLGGTIIEVDSPGLTAANPARFHYDRLRRPILPLDPEAMVEARWR
jgi:microcystin degradation protein MlrC